MHERYNEKELKDALIDKVNNFLIELGTGFAYMGREVRIEVGESEKFILMWQKTPCLYRREMNATSAEFTQVIEVDNRT